MGYFCILILPLLYTFLLMQIMPIIETSILLLLPMLIFLVLISLVGAPKKQATITRSTTEVEYHVIASTTIKVNWLTHMLRELDITLPSAPTIYCDNVGATYVCVNPVFHSRMKHITVDFHFVCDHLAKQQLRVSHVHSSDQLADCLTKPLARTQFHSHCSKLDILPNSLHLRGHDRTRL